MANETTPYISHNPGDLVTAEDWNEVQRQIKEDIAKQIKGAIQHISTVPNADNAAKLENKTADELSREIVQRALQELPTRTGYRKLFKRLKVNEEKVIKHGLEACPLVDVYQLEAFEVVCSEDGEKHKEPVNFYLYHSSEKKIRFTPSGTTTPDSVEIEPTDGTAYRIPFKDLLALYKVEYTETTSLGDLETEFWKALFTAPNDQFDDDQYCHSPWFDRCCGEQRTVEDLKRRGDWDDLWFKMTPRKTINYSGTAPTLAPTNIQVVHFDFDTLGIKLLPGLKEKELKVMVLLKV